MPVPRLLRAALLAPYLAVFYPFLVLRRAGAALRPGRAWWTWITPQLLLGGFLGPGDVRALERAGVRAVVNVSTELHDPRRALAAAGIAYLRVPCWDARAPSIEDAARGVQLIAEQVAAGQRVYVHCASGVGRSVALVLCYLATHEGRSVDEALGQIARLRPRVALRPGQRVFVDRFVAWARQEEPTGSGSPDRGAPPRGRPRPAPPPRRR